MKSLVAAIAAQEEAIQQQKLQIDQTMQQLKQQFMQQVTSPQAALVAFGLGLLVPVILHSGSQPSTKKKGKSAKHSRGLITQLLHFVPKASLILSVIQRLKQ